MAAPAGSPAPFRMFVVDGTGSSSDYEYRKDMSNGFCKRLERQCGATYWRGPTLLGTETTDIAREVVSAVTTWTCSTEGVNGRVFLAGHSRGGAAVIFAAQALQKLNVAVEAMFLYDAVDRTVNFRSAQTIPGNVGTCYHAMRDRSLAFYYTEGAKVARDELAVCIGMSARFRSFEEEDQLTRLIRNPPPTHRCKKALDRASHLDAEDLRMKYVMRAVATVTTAGDPSIDFGNCGTQAEAPCRYPDSQRETFLGSHGAIGGAPITDTKAPRLLLDADRAAIASVGAWMSKNLAGHGLFVS